LIGVCFESGRLAGQSEFSNQRKISPFSPFDCVAIAQEGTNVILGGSEVSRIFLQLRKADPSAEFTLNIAEGPRNDIAAQSLAKGGNSNSRSGDFGRWSSAP
jgi:hypothetical protein